MFSKTMRNLNRIGSILILAVMVIGSTPTLSHAYLDAGSGSMMVQLLLAGTAGFAVLAKLAWQKFLSLFKTIPEEENP
jgi:hypothetical protein